MHTPETLLEALRLAAEAGDAKAAAFLPAFAVWALLERYGPESVRPLTR
jgi:hypothetical protein